MTDIPLPGQDEQSLLDRLDADSAALDERLNFFASTSPSAVQVQSYISELNTFLSKFSSWQPAAARLQMQGRPVFSQRLAAVIQRVEYNLQTYQFMYNSKSAWERFQQQQGYPAGPGMPGGMPPRGGPGWYEAMTGMRCFWCGQDLMGMPQPVAICPRCGRFPTPPPS
jgi:hypothetical protein